MDVICGISKQPHPKKRRLHAGFICTTVHVLCTTTLSHITSNGLYSSGIHSWLWQPVWKSQKDVISKWLPSLSENCCTAYNIIFDVMHKTPWPCISPFFFSFGTYVVVSCLTATNSGTWMPTGDVIIKPNGDTPSGRVWYLVSLLVEHSFHGHSAYDFDFHSFKTKSKMYS